MYPCFTHYDKSAQNLVLVAFDQSKIECRTIFFLLSFLTRANPFYLYKFENNIIYALLSDLLMLTNSLNFIKFNGNLTKFLEFSQCFMVLLFLTNLTIKFSNPSRTPLTALLRLLNLKLDNDIYFKSHHLYSYSIMFEGVLI